MADPEVWDLDRLSQTTLRPAVVWATPSVRHRTEGRIPLPHADPGTGVGEETRTLIAVGGGTLLDQAKRFRAEGAPGLVLVAIPSIWGSGAEASPVVVTNEGRTKRIRMGPEFLPTARVDWPELADSLPAEMARHACGDTWAHALEALLSPLAEEAVRAEVADVIRRMLELPLGRDSRWFDVSREACRLQARSSVGLVHGIAHTLEGPLRELQPAESWGHAALCSTFLWPVMALNFASSGRAAERIAEAGLDGEAIGSRLRELHDPQRYERALTLLSTHWTNVLRDPCTRTNGTLVRASHLLHFQTGAFAA